MTLDEGTLDDLIVRSRLASYTLHLTSYTLHPAPCTLQPTPYNLHPTPYTLHPTPYTLHPTPPADTPLAGKCSAIVEAIDMGFPYKFERHFW